MNVSPLSLEERSANASNAFRSNSTSRNTPHSLNGMIPLSSSDPLLQNQILDLLRIHLQQQRIVSPGSHDLVLLSLLGSHNYDHMLSMQLIELQYQSFVNQLQSQHPILSPNAALSSTLMIPSHYQPLLQMQQRPFESRALDSILAVPNQQSQVSMLLPPLQTEEALATSVDGPPMNRELISILFGTQNRSSAVVTDPRSIASTLLAHPDDVFILSAYQIFLRQNIEVFQAALEETITPVRGRNTPIYIHQVGIRCIHCKHVLLARRSKGSMYFPSNTLRIYQAAQNMATTHMISGLCNDMPILVQDQFQALMVTKSTSGGGGREYWAKCAKDLGLVDTPNGIRFRCRESARLEALSYAREL